MIEGINEPTCYPYVGPVVDIFHAQICDGDTTLGVECHN